MFSSGKLVSVLFFVMTFLMSSGYAAEPRQITVTNNSDANVQIDFQGGVAVHCASKSLKKGGDSYTYEPEGLCRGATLSVSITYKDSDPNKTYNACREGEISFGYSSVEGLPNKCSGSLTISKISKDGVTCTVSYTGKVPFPPTACW